MRVKYARVKGVSDILNRSAGLKDEKRRRLFEAAIAEFNEYGRDNASFNRIIERSGLSKGTVYYYFDNKDALLTLVFDEIGLRLLRAVPDLPMPDTPEDFWKTLWAYRQKEFDFFINNPELGQILLMPRLSRKVIEQYDNGPEGSVARVVKRHIKLIERGQELGAVRSDLKTQTITDIIGAVIETACSFMFGDNVDPGTVRNSMEKYNAISRDMTYRVLLPVEKLGDYARFCIKKDQK